jgi:uncharacterized protein (TIGR02596 family)
MDVFTLTILNPLDSMTPSPSRIRGFSLIELLVVMLIIGIVAAFLVPATGTILRGSQLTQGSQILVDQFSLARQYALAKNHPVQVRLIRYADPEVPGEVVNGVVSAAGGAFRAIQIVDAIDGVDSKGNPTVYYQPVDKPQLLPQAIIMDQDTTTKLSTLILDRKELTSDTTASGLTPIHIATPGTTDPVMPRGIKLNYDFVYFRFMPDGSTDLPATTTLDAHGAWFVTLHNINDKAGVVPANFFTLQVDPVSGTLKQFRPGI